MNPNPIKSTGRFKTREQLESFVIANWVQTSMTTAEIARKSGASVQVVSSILHFNRERISQIRDVYPDAERFLLMIANQPHYRVPKEEIIEDLACQMLSKTPESMRSIQGLRESTYAALEEAWHDCGFEKELA